MTLNEIGVGMRMRFVLILFIFILGVAPRLPAEEHTAPLYQVGVSLPLTGDLGEYGVAVRNGIVPQA